MWDATDAVFMAYWMTSEEDPCVGCGAVWDDNIRDHTETCSYLAWQVRLESDVTV